MRLLSTSFDAMELMPKRFTCEGDDISPSLSWLEVPKDTKSFVIICDDPDAPTEKPFVHWVVYGIPVETTHFVENVSIGFKPGQQKGILGKNDFNKRSYNGPCPPKGHGMHHYHFTLYALAIMPDLQEGATKEEVLQTIQGHVLDQAKLIGRFERT